MRMAVNGIWKKDIITLEDGSVVEAQMPEIVSASRSTDIPAFYADWFFHRLKVGYSAWTNPFNGVKSYVAYRDTRFIVFWSKDPRPLLSHLHELEDRNIHCYIQYTLNDYEKEGLERGVPALDVRIDTFKRLVDALGKGHVIWRFDPLILTNTLTKDELLEKIEKIGDLIYGYTEKLVFSFVDIAAYVKVWRNLEMNHIPAHEWTLGDMMDFSKRLSDLNKRKWHYTLATCGEEKLFESYGIVPNRCIDEDLIIRFAWDDAELMRFLGVDIIRKNQLGELFGDMIRIPKGAIPVSENVFAVKSNSKKLKDKGQRPLCGCMISKDIGEYNTCPHLCEYCYANTSKALALSNYVKARSLGFGEETITGH